MTRSARNYVICIILLCFIGRSVNAQGLFPVTTDDKVQHSSLIVEGKVIGLRSYWNGKHTMIYTANTIEVYKIFKGNLDAKTIEITTVGGAVGNQFISASHYLKLQLNEIGVFFCQKDINQASPSTAQSFDVYSSMQGFLRYDLPTKSAAAPFVKFDRIGEGLYPELSKKTGRAFRIKSLKFSIDDSVVPRTPDGRVISSNSTLAPTITSFNPLVVNAGALTDVANNVLTINGNGFGASPSVNAAVAFAHADFGPGQFYSVPFNSDLIVSWSNTQIKVRVPDKAANGFFRVSDASGVIATSPSALGVRFSILDADLSDNSLGFKQFNLLNINNSGGYTVVYSTSTANSGLNINTSPAKATFQRALNTWKESVGVNIIEGGTTTSQQISSPDENNIVLFDNGGTGLAPLANGVLATCYSYLGFCDGTPAPDQAFKSGFDIIIRNTGFSTGSIKFSLGPCPPYGADESQVDLESVLLHELGHAINLGHINEPNEPFTPVSAGSTNPSKVMHFSVAYNFKRVSLDASALAGGLFAVAPKNGNYGNCVSGSPEMLPLTSTVLEPLDNCPATFPTSVTPVMTTVNFDLAHATSDKSVDPAYNQYLKDGTGTSITNNAWYVVKTNTAGGDLAVKVSNYETQPAAQSACVVGSQSIPVTGVQLAVYKVNTCPAGGSFPTPILSTSFKADGNLSPITGLSANQTYLLLFDGVENTKAKFSVELSGSALSSRFSIFTGTVEAKTNDLEWQLGTTDDIASMVLERSADGSNFTQLDDLSGGVQLNGTYTDDTPLAGSNYYRLAITNASGGVQYSTVLQLTRSQPIVLSIFPNPALSNQFLRFRVQHGEEGEYTLTIRNTLGQLVLSKQVLVTDSDYTESISVRSYMRGTYHVSIIDSGNKKIQTAVLIIR